MVLDTSAILAVLFDKPERSDFVRTIADARRRLISSVMLVEASIVVEARRGESAGRDLDRFLHRAAVQTVPRTRSRPSSLARRGAGTARADIRRV